MLLFGDRDPPETCESLTTVSRLAACKSTCKDYHFSSIGGAKSTKRRFWDVQISSLRSPQGLVKALIWMISTKGILHSIHVPGRLVLGSLYGVVKIRLAHQK